MRLDWEMRWTVSRDWKEREATQVSVSSHSCNNRSTRALRPHGGTLRGNNRTTTDRVYVGALVWSESLTLPLTMMMLLGGLPIGLIMIPP